MKINVVSLFPDFFLQIAKIGVVGRACQKKLWSLEIVNPRDFATNDYGRIDDRPYGGGAGMVMSYEPLRQSLQKLNIKKTSQLSTSSDSSKVLYLSPSGERLTQVKVERFSKLEEITLICGRYEGVDQRFIDTYVDEEVSLGDYVLSGGEPAALCFIDAVIRLLPQVLGNDDSLGQESYSDSWDGLLDYPHYTRPEEIEGQVVPEVLLRGNHQKIEQWRRHMSLQRTYQRRPDLMTSALLQEHAKLKGKDGFLCDKQDK